MSDNEPLTQEDYTSDDDVGSLVLDAPDPVPPTNVNYFLIAEDLVRYTEEHLGVLDILVIAREIASCSCPCRRRLCGLNLLCR
jgi:hypothetical protein